MTLGEFATHCQTDDRLTSVWDHLVLCAHDVIEDMLELAFRRTEAHLAAQHREEFEAARMELLVLCAHVQAPELSVKKFIEFLLQY